MAGCVKIVATFLKHSATYIISNYLVYFFKKSL